MPLDAADLARLRDVIIFGEKVAAIIAGVSREQFQIDAKTLFAVCYGIQVVGEAAWKLSDGFKQTHPTIPWPMIANMRHRLVHDYGRTDETVVYQVATVHLPQLIEQARKIQASSERPTGLR
jgi:uncharacterized protein with HEPN domain